MQDSLSLGGPKGKPQPNIKINDNIFAGGYYCAPVGGLNNCARDKPSPEAKFDACWSNWSFAGNAVSAGWTSTSFRIGPMQRRSFPRTSSRLGTLISTQASAATYRLGSGSPLRGKALDGSSHPGAPPMR